MARARVMKLDAKAAEVVRSPVLKVISIGNDDRGRELTNSADEGAYKKFFTNAGAIEPPYNPRTLCELFEASSTLRPNVDAMAANVDGNGHHLEPLVDPDSDDVVDHVAEAIYVERLAARDRGMVVPDVIPTVEEATERLQEVEDAMRLERFKVEQFFESCTIEESFVALRKKLRQDLEVTGNAYWEVLRDARGQVCQFSHLQSHTMRLLPQGREFVEVKVPVRVAPLTMGTEVLRRRFRRFVQVVEQQKVVFFKEFGDPRAVSAKTGKVYKTELELKREEPGSPIATEVLHFRIYSSTTPYGIPRWIGNLLNVMGSRSADEVNFLYFDNKGVPPLALLVSGGRVSEDSVDKLRDFIDNEIKGKRNFHKILVIEAEPTGGDSPDGLGSGRMKLELKPLTQAQQSDALFLKYDERNHDKIGMSWRLPRLIRGDVRDFNRATADAALEFAEAQVFGPERVDFDFQMMRVVFASLGIRYWRYRSNAVQVHDPRVIADIIAKLTSANVLVPNDSRQLAGELVFNRPLAKIDADWTGQPVMLSQVGIPLDAKRDGKIPGLDESTAPAGPGEAPAGAPAGVSKRWWRASRKKVSDREASLLAMVTDLVRVRDELVKAEEEAAAKDHARAAADDPRPEVERITMPLDEMVKRFRLVPAAS